MQALRALARWRLDPVRLDWLLAAVLTADGLLEIRFGDGGGSHPAASALALVVLTGSVAVRRRYPFLVGTAVPIFATLNHALWTGPQSTAVPIANFCALYALTVWTPPRRFVVGTALVTAANLGVAAFPGNSLRGTLPWTVIVLVVMLLVRSVVGDRERRAQIAERERDVAAREAVVEERARIARELHDVIAHHVSMMVVQAGAERRAVDQGTATRLVLETIEETGRSALTEMRRLLGVLRSNSEDSLAPQPGLHDVPQLVEQLRSAGLAIDYRVDGDPRSLPVGLELSAYRIVQEALTNSLKHADGARTTVHIRYGHDQLGLEVSDDGGVGGAAPAAGGHGLAGMRERVALYGGRLDAGRMPDGGFAVNVLLPIR
ncbi:MAG TPA: histidine kinase [Gaiellales bacterium]|nr:histidine kinase [Gaiellales bacterium]